MLWDEPLSRHTYYRIGGKAPLLVIPEGESDLFWLKERFKNNPFSYFILGMGSNLLVSDDGIPSLVIKTTKLCFDFQETQKNEWRVGASISVTTLLREAAKRGLSGFESLIGIPGSVGGVIYMNAGTHLGEAKDTLIATRSFLLESAEDWIERNKSDLKFEYRKNHFVRSDEILFSSTWMCTSSSPELVKKTIDETLARRKSTQPLEYPSCGSVFKNPHPKRAWEVIEKIGLRGHRIGNAAFSEKHPNFIVNLGGAKANDVWELIRLAKNRAKSELGIDLQEEVRFLGNFPAL